MLSFSFSSFAQSTVSTEDELKTALMSSENGNVVLGNDITVTSNITIQKNAVMTLDLNGHVITANSTKITYNLAVGAKLIIDDSVGGGKVDGVYWQCNPSSVLIFNSGEISRAGRLVYSSGQVIVNGGSLTATGQTIINVTNNAVQLPGSGSLTVNGGSVGSVYLSKNSKLTITEGATIELGARFEENSSLDAQGGIGWLLRMSATAPFSALSPHPALRPAAAPAALVACSPASRSIARR